MELIVGFLILLVTCLTFLVNKIRETESYPKKIYIFYITSFLQKFTKSYDRNF